MQAASSYASVDQGDAVGSSPCCTAATTSVSTTSPLATQCTGVPIVAQASMMAYAGAGASQCRPRCLQVRLPDRACATQHRRYASAEDLLRVVSPPCDNHPQGRPSPRGTDALPRENAGMRTRRRNQIVRQVDSVVAATASGDASAAGVCETLSTSATPPSVTCGDSAAPTATDQPFADEHVDRVVQNDRIRHGGEVQRHDDDCARGAIVWFPLPESDLGPTSLKASATGLCSVPEYVALTTAAHARG